MFSQSPYISICHNRVAKELEEETFRYVFLQFAIAVDGWQLSYDVAPQIALAAVWRIMLSPST